MTTEPSPVPSLPPEATSNSGVASNTKLLNDFIDLNFSGGLIGTDSAGKDKTSLRVRLGDSVTIKTNLPVAEEDDAATIRETAGVTNVATQSVTQFSPLYGDTGDAIRSLTPLDTGQMYVGNTAAYPSKVGPLTNGQLLIGSTGGLPQAASLTSNDSSVTVTNGAGTVDLSGKLIQAVRTGTTTPDSTSTQIPSDGTIPQNGEGKQYLSLTITPKSASNILEFTFSAYVATTVASGVAVALFQDSTANALSATLTSTNATIIPVHWTFSMVAATTNSTTFKLRFGPTTATTAYINQYSTGQLLGAVEAATLIVREYAP